MAMMNVASLQNVGSIGFKWGIDRSILGMAATGEARPKVVDTKAVFAEFVAMTMFVVIGCGTACVNGASDGETRLLVAFAFGMAILVLAYSIGHHSGGHINCAVTFALVLQGQVPWYQGIANCIAQMLGSLLGALILMIIIPCELDLTTTLGTNIIAGSKSEAFAAEVFGTFVLCFVVFETAVTPQASCGKNACIAIGFAVFLAHVLMLPIDGCSINPTRSFGPAIMSKIRACGNYTEGGLDDLWIMWLAPLIGAACAAVVQLSFAPPTGKDSTAWTTLTDALDKATQDFLGSKDKGAAGAVETGGEEEEADGDFPEETGKTGTTASRTGTGTTAGGKNCFPCMRVFGVESGLSARRGTGI